MNKKVLYSFAMIIIVASLAVSGTYAYFTADRTTSANRFSAGTLDLDISSDDGKLEPFVIDNIGSSATISGEKTWTVKNTGSLPGKLLVRLENVVNNENGCNDQEKKAEPNCGLEGDEGDLGSIITLKIALDGVDMIETNLTNNEDDALDSKWDLLEDVVLEADEEKEITVSWLADESSYGNEIQSDDIQFDVNFRLVQLVN